MKTEYLDELYPRELIEKLSQLGVELTEDQRRILINSGRTWLYTYRKKRVKGTLLYRLSYPMYLVWNIFLTFFIQPIKWVFTGNIYFNADNKVYKFTVKWGRKIGL